MTASKPETALGEIGFAGSHAIWSSPVTGPRTRRVTSYPRVLKGGRSAAPIGPETPLTRIREIMADRLSLYQLAAPATKFVENSKVAKRLKRKSSAQDVKHLRKNQRAGVPAPHERWRAIIVHGELAPADRDHCPYAHQVPGLDEADAGEPSAGRSDHYQEGLRLLSETS